MMSGKSLRRLGRSLAVSGIVAMTASAVQAGLTPVNPTPWAKELNLDQILTTVYGSGVVATRVDDSADQNWSGVKVVSSRAIAKYALNGQSFWFGTGNGLTKQFDVTGSGLNVGGNAGSFTASSFTVNDGSAGKVLSSDPSKNGDGKDHVVTYLIESGTQAAQLVVPGHKTYVLFFEDSLSPKGDFDFNDMGVEVNTTAIPLPTAVGMGLVGLGLVASKRVRRMFA